jgi:hypothetical protein
MEELLSSIGQKGSDFKFDSEQFTDWMKDKSHPVPLEESWSSDFTSPWPGLLKIVTHLVG